MGAFGIFFLFGAQCLRFSAADFIAKQGSLRVEESNFYDVLAHLMDDFQVKSKTKSLQQRTAVLQGEAPNALASTLRLRPEYFNKLVSYFEYLDKNSDAKLDQLEFMQVAKYDTSLRSDCGEVYDLFSNNDGKSGMTLQEFLRLVTVVTETPGGFDYQAGDLKALPSSTVAEDQDRDAFFRLFVVFDENSNGDVDKHEFEHAWMGPTLWTLRKKGILSSRWMASTAEFEFAKSEYAARAGSDGVLSLGEFARLLKDAVPHRDDHYSGGSPYTGPLAVRGPFKDSSPSSQGPMNYVFVFITFAFGTAAGLV